VVRFACEDTQFLIQQNVKAIVVACNTASAWALPMLERQFALPVFGVIIPGACAALEKSQSRRIGVIGTNATIRSQAYSKAILARCDTAQVFTQACPLLVPLVEEAWNNHPVTRRVLREYLTPLLRQRIDTLVLGCTHYPLLKEAIREVTKNKIALVDSAESCARYVKERLTALKLLRANGRHRGTIQPFVTDEVERFNESAARFLGQKAEPAWKIDLLPMP
jgi:glutamate racemase